MRPLEGLLVLDFSTLLPGPLASEMLVQAGARVLKIERPGNGDDMRGYEPRWGSSSANFAVLNAGKQSIAMDLKNVAARASLRPLIEQADILIEQFRPGVMARLELDYERLSQINPRLIYCSISGFGQNGPKRDIAAHDLNYIAEAGLLGLSHGPAYAPVLPPALIADIAAGSYPAIMNILLALQARHKTGRGCYLDIAMTDNLFPFLYWVLAKHGSTGQFPKPGDELVTGASPRYNLYPTRDGRVVAAAPLEDKFWEAFCDIIELPPALRDDAQAPAAVRERIAALIKARASAEWAKLFAARDCCCVIVKTIEEALADPHFQARGLFSRRVQDGSGANMAAAPMPLAPIFRQSTPESLPVPALGENNLGYRA